MKTRSLLFPTMWAMMTSSSIRTTGVHAFVYHVGALRHIATDFGLRKGNYRFPTSIFSTPYISSPHFRSFPSSTSVLSSSLTRRFYSNTRHADEDEVKRRAKDINIPIDRLDINFARSSGPGGQNVNKVNTKAEVRFNVRQADWLTREVKDRLLDYQSAKINKDGDLIVSSQEHRVQSRNKEECFQKLKEMIAEASMTPKEREMWVGIGEKTKEKRRDDKRKRGEIKSMRRVNKNSFDD